jgi:hypothetical protein
MNTAHRLQSMVGLALLVIAVLGFIVSLVTNLPKDTEVAAQAQPLQVLPRDFFSGNAVAEQVRKLSVPNGVPVNLDANNLGRSNVFERY